MADLQRTIGGERIRTPRAASAKKPIGSRAFWLRQMRQWHWISAAVCLIGMLLFAFTGITLNHASQIEARPQVTARAAKVPADLLQQVKAAAQDRKEALPPALRAWLAKAIDVSVGDREGEWSAQEIYVSLPRAGGDAWVSIDLDTGEARYEQTDRGWISFLNDLHKGRNAGAIWTWFIDLFAVACVVFCLSGLVLMQLMASSRPSTWPLVGLGFVIPVVLVIFFLH
jgi:hypothetical protein